MGREMIFDPLRKKWVVLTPEEWVRQNFLQFLLQVKRYPVSLIAIEKEIKLGELKKRFDVLVYDTQLQPWMMIECKAADVELTGAVLQQVLRYNLSTPVRYMAITNGHYCYVCVNDNGQLLALNELPDHT